MFDKRINLFCGHYGSGKTNIAVNAAEALQKKYGNVAVADLDIVNPYFRTKDSEAELNAMGIELICSPYANSNLDIPALPQQMYAVTDDRSRRFVLDVGGDDRGALALGRLSPAIAQENDYDMFCVINMYRPLTSDTDSVLGVMGEIETACGLHFSALINNSNLGAHTCAQDVLDSAEYARDISKACSLPLVCTCVREELFSELEGKIPGLMPLKLQNKIIKE